MLQNDASIFAYSLAMHEVITAPTIHTVSAAAPKARAPSPPVDTVNAAVAATTLTPIAIADAVPPTMRVVNILSHAFL